MGLILGLDISLSATGMAIYAPLTNHFTFVDLIRTRDKTDGEELDRIHLIVESIQERIGKDVTAIGYEDGFVGKNAQASMSLAKVRGAVAFAFFDYRPYSMQPGQIKKLCCNNGNAKKEQVAEYLRKVYADDVARLGIGPFNDKHLSPNKTSDIYDAMSIALAYKRLLDSKI